MVRLAERLVNDTKGGIALPSCGYILDAWRAQTATIAFVAPAAGTVFGDCYFCCFHCLPERASIFAVLRCLLT
jgi:hypothetical protein